MLEHYSVDELEEFQAYFRVHPFGEDVQHYMLAQIIALIQNYLRAEGTDLVDPTDVMPKVDLEAIYDEIRAENRYRRERDAMSQDDLLEEFLASHRKRMGKE